MAGAASRVLAELYPLEPAARLERQAQEIADARVKAGVNYPSDTDAGLALGRQVAERVIERARNDGSDRKWDGSKPGPGPRYWEPLFPAYVSGHSTYSAAAAEVLANAFPDQADLWRARGREAGLSRIWGGIHWPVDHVFGARMGRKIGALTVARAERDGAGQ